MPFLTDAEREAERLNYQRHGSRFGLMRVIGSGQFSGRLYRCPCGVEAWTVWGRALKHASQCPQARGEKP